MESLIKAGAITDPRSISKEFVLGKEYEVILLEDDQYYVDEYHMIWVPYEDNNFMRVLRTDADYICPIQEFNMLRMETWCR